MAKKELLLCDGCERGDKRAVKVGWSAVSYPVSDTERASVEFDVHDLKCLQRALRKALYVPKIETIEPEGEAEETEEEDEATLTSSIGGTPKAIEDAAKAEKGKGKK